MAEVGFWTWNPITSLPDTAVLPVTINPSTTPVSKTITGANLRKSVQRVFDVQSYGAVGDDSTDDTIAVQAAITAAESASGTVFFPPGTYKIAGSLTIDSGTDIELTGPGATIKQYTAETATLVLTDVSRIGVHHLRFYGLGSETPWAAEATDYNGVAGVYVDGGSHISIANCVFENHAGPDVVLTSITGTLSGVSICDNVMIGMGSGVISSGDNGADGGIGGTGNINARDEITIRGNDISGHAFGILLGPGAGIIIEGNLIHDIPGQHGMYLIQGGDMVVSGNTVVDCAVVGLKVQHQLDAEVVAAVTIATNTIARCGSVGLAVGANTTDLLYYTNNASITGNNVYDTDMGIYLLCVKSMHVTGNRIRLCSAYGMQVTSCGGTIVNNRIEQTERCAIACAYPLDSLIIDGLYIVDCPINVAVDNNSGSVYRCAIYLNDVESPNWKKYYIGNVHIRFERETQIMASDNGYMQAAILSAVNSQVFQTGPIINELAVIGNSFLGSYTDLRTMLDQGAPVAIAGDGNTAITIAQLRSKLITMASSGSARAPTVPTGTDTAVIPLGQSIDWTLINTGDQVVTLTAAANHTLVPTVITIAAGTSGSFRTRHTATNTAITYKL